MVKKYYIREVNQDWLQKPGMVIYVEREYDELVNRYIRQNLPHIQDMFQKEGLTFLYIPDFYSSLPAKIYQYYTGKELSDTRTPDVLHALLPNAVLNQIQAPSLLFSGISKHACEAYAIGRDTSFLSMFSTSKKLKYIENSLNYILSQTKDKYVVELPPATEESSHDDEEVEEEICNIRFRVTDAPKIAFDRDEDEEKFNGDACKKAQEFVAGLLKKGYTQEAIWALLAPAKELSPIKITKDLRISLPLYKLEIKLPPVQKAVYLLFLSHPEGIYFKNMPDYHDELLRLYRKLAIRGMADKHLATIEDLVNPLSNSMNEKCSIIKKRILDILDDSLAKHYYISGNKGELKRIDIKPEMIVWE